MGTMLRELRARFAAAVRARGADYHRHGHVELANVTRDRVVATVQGTQPYEVRLRHYGSADRFESTCECLYFADTGPCKHVWATLLAVAAVEGLGAAVVEQERAIDGADDAVAPASPRAPAARGARPPAPPAWQARLG